MNNEHVHYTIKGCGPVPYQRDELEKKIRDACKNVRRIETFDEFVEREVEKANDKLDRRIDVGCKVSVSVFRRLGRMFSHLVPFIKTIVLSFVSFALMMKISQFLYWILDSKVGCGYGFSSIYCFWFGVMVSVIITFFVAKKAFTPPSSPRS